MTAWRRLLVSAPIGLAYSAAIHLTTMRVIMISIRTFWRALYLGNNCNWPYDQARVNHTRDVSIQVKQPAAFVGHMQSKSHHTCVDQAFNVNGFVRKQAASQDLRLPSMTIRFLHRAQLL